MCRAAGGPAGRLCAVAVRMRQGGDRGNRAAENPRRRRAHAPRRCLRGRAVACRWLRGTVVVRRTALVSRICRTRTSKQCWPARAISATKMSSVARPRKSSPISPAAGTGTMPRWLSRFDLEMSGGLPGNGVAGMKYRMKSLEGEAVVRESQVHCGTGARCHQGGDGASADSPAWDADLDRNARIRREPSVPEPHRAVGRVHHNMVKFGSYALFRKGRLYHIERRLCRLKDECLVELLLPFNPNGWLLIPHFPRPFGPYIGKFSRNRI